LMDQPDQELPESNMDVVSKVMTRPDRLSKAMACFKKTQDDCKEFKEWQTDIDFNQVGDISRAGYCLARQYQCENRAIDRLDPVTQLVSGKVVNERYSKLAAEEKDAHKKAIYEIVAKGGTECDKNAFVQMPDYEVDMKQKPASVSAEEAKIDADSFKRMFCYLKYESGDTPFQFTYELLKTYFPWLIVGGVSEPVPVPV